MPIPAPTGRTTGALAEWAGALRAALVEANGRLRDVREWYGNLE